MAKRYRLARVAMRGAARAAWGELDTAALAPKVFGKAKALLDSPICKLRSFGRYQNILERGDRPPAGSGLDARAS
jgi:hypothetical protein